MPLILLLLLAFGLQLWTAGRIHGYPIADSVEYLERAKLFLDGERLDPGTVRSFAFSGLLVPVVAALRFLGDEAVLGAARLVMMLAGLATIAVSARLTARLFGGGAGLAAAFALAVNPVFLQWSVEPLSGTAAALCVALAFVALLETGGFRRGLLVGAALGAAFLMAFQSLAVIACVGGLLLVRERWRGRAYTFGWMTAILVALLLQASLDKAVYGQFGTSVWEYAKENFGGTLSTKLYWFGQQIGNDDLQQLGLDLYNASFPEINEENQAARIVTKSKMPRSWYLTHLHTHLWAWPILGLCALGIARALRRPTWPTTILLLTWAVNAWVMSDKGWKDYRLWLPLLPALVVFVGAGWSLASGPGAARGLRTAALCLLLAWSAKSGTDILARTNLAKHGGYWDAVAFVAEERARTDAGPERFAAGYHWATLFRDGGDDLEQVKLPHPLYSWPVLEEAREPLREPVLAEIATLDWFVSHVQLIDQDPAIAAAIAARFEVVAAFHDGATAEELAPILVFRRLPDEQSGEEPGPRPGARRLFTFDPAGDPGAVQATVAHPRSIDLRRRFEGGVTDQLVLLGWDARVLPGSESVLWLTLHWFAGPTNGRDYTMNLRVTDPDDRARQVNRTPCWGVHPTSTWSTGTVVSDGIPIPLGEVPGPGDTRLAPLGGANRRGELLPLRIWLATPRYEADAEGVLRPVGGLAPFHASGLRPVHKEVRNGRLVSDDGWTFSHDNLVLVGGLHAPIPEALRVPDDGRPIEP